MVDSRRTVGGLGLYGRSAGTTEQKRRAKAAREQYKPEQVRCLLIAEALPDSLDRFFYYPDVRRADYLFLGVMQVLYPSLKEEFLAAKRPSALKEGMLRRFQAEGFFLLDILDGPLGRSPGPLQRAVPELLSRVEMVVDQQTPIVLIKATTFEVAYEPLKAAGYQRVYHRPIPFPSQGWQHRFHDLFRRALKESGISWTAE